MTAQARRVRSPNTTPAWHAGFMALLPRIRACARYAFRDLNDEARQEAVQCVITSALAAYVRLVQLGKADIAYAVPLATYAIRHYRGGRHLGSRLNVRDISSLYAQKAKSIHLERLDRYDSTEDQWQEILVEDRHAGPFDIVRTKLDFTAWLRSLPIKLRRIARTLANGERTRDVARKFSLSPGRISQIRSELLDSWRRFVGDAESPAAATSAA